MMKPLRLFIPVEPVAKARPRFSRFGHTYTPKKTATYEKAIRVKLKELLKGASVCTMPLSISINFFLRRPKSVKRIYPSVRPDIDNYAKAVLDAMNEIVYEDDAQVVGLSLSKCYSDHPGVEIFIEGKS